MLGSSIKVLVGETITPPSNGQYRVCRARSVDLKNTDASLFRIFTVGAEPAQNAQSLRVIAVTPTVNGEPCAVATPDKLRLFEPQLREQLGHCITESPYDLTCLNEKSCGAVVFRRKSGNTEFLLVKNKKGSNWGFPKGHIEKGETEKDTAIREVLEETGVQITPLEGFRAISEYHPKGKIVKQVVFFIAEMNGEEITIQQSEIDRFVWADYGLAMKLFRFNNDRNVLTKARDWLKRH